MGVNVSFTYENRCNALDQDNENHNSLVASRCEIAVVLLMKTTILDEVCKMVGLMKLISD